MQVRHEGGTTASACRDAVADTGMHNRHNQLLRIPGCITDKISCCRACVTTARDRVGHRGRFSVGARVKLGLAYRQGNLDLGLGVTVRCVEGQRALLYVNTVRAGDARHHTTCVAALRVQHRAQQAWCLTKPPGE